MADRLVHTVACARRALAVALRAGGSTPGALLVTAYMRILLAARAGRGVRLSAAEVGALYRLDSAVSLAALNIEEELLAADDQNG